MIAFVIATILLIVALLALVVGSLMVRAPEPEPARDGYGRKVKSSDDEPDPRKVGHGLVGIGVALLLVGGITMVMDSYTRIPVRTVGIELSFGKPVQPLTNGFHWVAPWHDIDKEWDGSMQTLKREDSPKHDGCQGVTVRLATQTTACVDVTLQWRIHPSADVIGLYKDYKTFGNVEENLVSRQLTHALNDAFAGHDPLRSITGTNDAPSQTNDDLAKKTAQTLQASVGQAIQIVSVTIPIIHYDGPTEDRLRQFQQALADTRIATQRQQTAQAQRAANDILAGSASNHDPGVQYQNCLNLISDLAQKNQLKDLPPTFNCGSTGQTPVIVGK